ncbi:uncharacterized protein LOC144626417 [Crassostrea virginica]
MSTASFRVLEQHRASLSDDAADGADQGPGCSDGTTQQTEHTKEGGCRWSAQPGPTAGRRCRRKHNGDPPPDGAVMSSELHISFIILSHQLINVESLSAASFRVLEQHRASLSDDAADGADQGPGCSDGRPSKRSTPRIHRRATQLPISW